MTDLSAAAYEVRKYWRDWPQERRDAVRALSSFLADAIEALAAVTEEPPARGECGACGRVMRLTKAGVLRHHYGDFYVGGWRQVCEGAGAPPKEPQT